MLTMCNLSLIVLALYLSIETVYSNTEKRDQDWLEWSTNRYKIYGITNKSEICIDNCVDGTCITDWDYNTRKPCNVIENGKTHVYFTARYKHEDKFLCLSRCGKFGYKHEWCLVTKDGDWDYCSSEEYKGKHRIQLTETRIRCITPCSPAGSDGEHVCKDPFDISRKCNPNITVNYIPHKTIQRNICVGPCSRFGFGVKSQSYRCLDFYSKVELCAPPAKEQNYTKEMFDKFYSKDYSMSLYSEDTY